MTRSDFKARGAPKASGGTKGPPKPSSRTGGHARRPSAKKNEEATTVTGLVKYITPKEFLGVMGRKNRSWTWEHRNDPGFPQAVWINGVKMYVEAECQSYARSFLDNREATKPGMPKKKKGA